MDDPGSSIILYIVLIVCCAYFAGTETALASVNRIHIISRASKGDKRAERTLKILDNFDEALSVLLIGNNIGSIALASLTVVMADDFFGKGYVGIATLLTTFILFVFGETVPKSVARSLSEQFALFSSGILLLLMKIFKPLSYMLSVISGIVVKPFKKFSEDDVTLTEDELTDIVENISENENFDKETGELVKSALRFTEKTAKDILVPWGEVLKIHSYMKAPEIIEIIKNTGHSRIPVVDRMGNVKGILQIRKFLKAYFERKNNIVLASVTDYPYFVKEDEEIGDLLEKMSKHRRNLAFVNGKEGNISGIITIEDILEELVGEIYDEDDKAGDENA